MSSHDEKIAPACLRVREAAAYLACSERTVWALITDGKLPAVRFSRQVVRIERTDLDAFIARCKRASL